MEKLLPPQHMTPLSASRIKTLENCSWYYFCNYVLRLPQTQNDGARKGSVCHCVFELLLSPKHKKNYDAIIKGGSVCSSPSVERVIKLYFKKEGLVYSTETFAQIDAMILVGLKTDFFGEGGKFVAPEYKFEIVNESPKYYLKGFIDKLFIRDGTLFIDDFKSSKKKYEGEDHESNLQGLIYSLAGTKLWPELSPHVRFIFLQYPEDPMQELKFSKDTLNGLEHYLEAVQKRVDRFDEEDAKSAFAADQVVTGSEFKGKLLCGFAKQKGQLKKDGKPMWACTFKFPFKYFGIKNKDGFISRCHFTKEEVKLKEGETVEEMQYDGCPRHCSKALDNTQVECKTYKNCLDDF